MAIEHLPVSNHS